MVAALLMELVLAEVLREKCCSVGSMALDSSYGNANITSVVLLLTM